MSIPIRTLLRSSFARPCVSAVASPARLVQARYMSKLDDAANAAKEFASDVKDQTQKTKDTLLETKTDDLPDEAKTPNLTNVFSSQGTAWEQTGRKNTSADDKIENRLAGQDVLAEGAKDKPKNQ
ncbi:hypothetical protein [Phaffia rhodozyma]|uniref:Uncharacterized protein n=1 Tax=Phaffia rhodozyma TaxID=264483 RepID=A0A0F7SK35_PHARH|nr:hypothetical protein [Phaffia rhodozyma]